MLDKLVLCEELCSDFSESRSFILFGNKTSPVQKKSHLSFVFKQGIINPFPKKITSVKPSQENCSKRSPKI